MLWDFDPPMITSPFEIRWYGVMFAAGFAISYFLMLKVVKKEGIDSRWLDRLLLFIMVGTVVGARLGHVFFYDWDSYKDDLIKIFFLREGGLASHGGAIGVALAIWLFNRRNKAKKRDQRSWLWTIDRVAVFVALTGVFIRTGNLTNHEIVGHPTNSTFGVVFSHPLTEQLEQRVGGISNVSFEAIEQTRFDSTMGVNLQGYTLNANFHPGIDPLNAEEIAMSTIPRYVQGHFMNSDSPRFRRFMDDDPPVLAPDNQSASVPVWGIPRHPAQVYEALSYLVIFLILYWLFLKKAWGQRPGLLLGAFLVLIFSARFGIEFLKIKQSAFAAEMSLNMGHLLSIPAVMIGIFLMVRAFRRPPVIEGAAVAKDEPPSDSEADE